MPLQGLNRSQKQSPDRIPSACEHYDNCNGCDYLHTSYENEIKLKESALRHYLRKLKNSNLNTPIDLPFKIFSTQNRFSYRNRIQFHYNKDHLGYYTKLASQKKIIQAKHCLLPHPTIQEHIREYYDNWQKIYHEFVIQGRNKKSGHLEFQMISESKCQVLWNRPYGNDSFTQVNNEMNEKLQSYVTDTVSKIKKPPLSFLPLLDLFGGSGNLTANCDSKQTLVVDYRIKQDQLKDHQDSYELDLEPIESISLLDELIKTKLRKDSIHTLLINPPRMGHKHLAKFLHHFPVQYLIYVSCRPDTLIRDLSMIETNYRFKKRGPL